MNRQKTILKKSGIALLLQAALYVVQYVIIPICYMPHPLDNAMHTYILYSTTIIIVLLGQLFFVKNIWCWMATFPIYPILVKIYHPKELYGIGYQGSFMNFHEDFDIISIAATILIIEILMCIAANLIRWLKGRRYHD